MEKVVDVSIQVTCLESDAGAVQASLRQWFEQHDVAMVQRPRTGVLRISEPRPVRPWMREALGIDLRVRINTARKQDHKAKEN